MNDSRKEGRQEKEKVEFLVFWGLPDSGQKEFREAVAPGYRVVTSPEEAVSVLSGGEACLLEGGNLAQGDRAPFIEAALAAGAVVRAVMFQFDAGKYPVRFSARRGRTVPTRYAIPRELAPNDMPDLEEGFDEVRYAFRNESGWTSARFEAREPMFEFVRNPDGTTTRRELDRAYFMIDRPGSLGCGLMSRAAFERFARR